MDRTEDGVVGTAMTNGFIANPILLIREGQANESGDQEVCRGTGEGIQGSRTDPE
jgi:hypothetical protein